MKKYLNGLLILIGIIILIAYITADHTEKKPDDRYSKEWLSPDGKVMVEISRALVKNNVHGCGEYYYRENSTSKGEILVACTSDGKSWKYYLVWPLIGSVTGPLSDTFTPPAKY